MSFIITIFFLTEHWTHTTSFHYIICFSKIMLGTLGEILSKTGNSSFFKNKKNKNTKIILAY